MSRVAQEQVFGLKAYAATTLTFESAGDAIVSRLLGHGRVEVNANRCAQKDGQLHLVTCRYSILMAVESTYS